MIKIFFNLFLITGIFITSYGSDFRHPSTCLGSGFLIGGYGIFHEFVFHSKDSVFNGAEEDFWEYDATQRASGGGGFIGYGVPFCDRFILALKVAATGFSSKATNSYFDFSPVFSYRNKMRIKYAIDINLEPGTLIGNNLLLYVKFGGSYVELRQARQILDQDIPANIVGQDTQNFHNWGYVFGAGAQTLITRCLSAFVEVDGRSYPLNQSKRRIDNTDDEDAFFEYRLIRLYGYGLRFGLMMGF